ncbi:hypothetical protein QBC35DRAFT_153656 [Podospora australis]|uniref:Uncharacterized protein n=1 Tax=Podospora australis TaxID=1536484 RepID=A0AAN6WZ96_9PEZI|nr:hypothetical protein QBC35DRAFT_153656 [Podospora australis]
MIRMSSYALAHEVFVRESGGKHVLFCNPQRRAGLVVVTRKETPTRGEGKEGKKKGKKKKKKKYRFGTTKNTREISHAAGVSNPNSAWNSIDPICCCCSSARSSSFLMENVEGCPRDEDSSSVLFLPTRRTAFSSTHVPCVLREVSGEDEDGRQRRRPGGRRNLLTNHFPEKAPPLPRRSTCGTFPETFPERHVICCDAFRKPREARQPGRQADGSALRWNTEHGISPMMDATVTYLVGLSGEVANPTYRCHFGF